LSLGLYMCDNQLLSTQADLQAPVLCCLPSMRNDVSGQLLSVSSYTTSLRTLIREQASLLLQCQVN
jgi:hypothetical protein